MSHLWSEERKAALIRRYDDGATIAALAAEFHCSEHAVRHAVKRWGVKHDTPQAHRVPDCHWSDVERARILALHNAGFTVPHIAAEMQTTRNVIRHALDRWLAPADDEPQNGPLPARALGDPANPFRTALGLVVPPRTDADSGRRHVLFGP
ncbi:transposase-like protein [Paraburkholderia youngii]|uniref:helix-turn-helix domain-containing protein n=1 Tax=Paraburkholderia youngii TaxID=2782701 RepID=UPI003D20EFC4